MIRYAVCSIRTTQVLSLHTKLSAACRARERQLGVQGTWVCPVEVCDYHADQVYAVGTCGCWEKDQLAEAVWDAYDQWEEAERQARRAESTDAWQEAYQEWAASMAKFDEL